MEAARETGPDGVVRVSYRSLPAPVPAIERELLIGTLEPVLAGLAVDDRGRLWVERVVAEGAAPVFDLFDREGRYDGTGRLGFQPAAGLPPRVRDGRL